MRTSRAVSGMLLHVVLQLEEATWSACNMRMDRAVSGILILAVLQQVGSSWRA